MSAATVYRGLLGYPTAHPGVQQVYAVVFGRPGVALSGSLATRYSDFSGFRPIFGQSWPHNPSRTTGLVLQCRLHQKPAPQTNSKTISWQFGIRKSPPSNEPLRAAGYLYIFICSFFVDSDLVRDGRGTLFPAPGVDSGPVERGSEGARGPPNPVNNNICWVGLMGGFSSLVLVP